MADGTEETPTTVPIAVPDLTGTRRAGQSRTAAGVTLPGLDDVDPVQLRAVQEALLDPSLILRAKRSPDGVVVDFVCEDANEAACTGLEVPHAELVGALLSEAVPGELGEFLFDRCADTVESGEPLAFDDLRTPQEDGSFDHYDVRAVAVGDRVCFSWRDVTERYRSQQALAESRNRYRLLAEHSSDVVVLVRPDGTVEWVSPAVRDMLGWEPEELIGRPVAEYVLPEDHRRRMALHRHPAAVHPTADEVRCRRADGAYLWVSARTREIRDDEHRLVNVVVSVRDVHKQVQARRALVASENRFRMLAENVTDIVYQVVDGRIVWISPSVERVLGWDPADVVGRPSFDLIAPEDLARAELARAGVVADRPLEGFECRFLTPDGDRRWMLAHARRIDAEGRDYGLVAGLRDIHEGHASRLALAALAAVNSALVGAVDEAELVADVCRLLVDEGGYRTARFRHADDASVPPPTSGVRARIELPVSVDGRVDGTLVVTSGEQDAFGPAAESTLLQLAHQMGMAVSRIRTRQQLVDALNERELLSTAIEQAGESVVVTGLDDRILYANPAAAATSGYPLEEIIGSSPRLFASGLHGPDFDDRVGAVLAAGQTWRGVVVSRARSGQLYEEDTTITPVHGDDGEVSCFVAVRRNISRELRLESDLDRLRSDRDSIVRLMSEVRVGATIEATAASFCEAVTRIGDVDVARVLLVEPDGAVVPLGITGAVYLGWETGVPLTSDGLPDLLDRTGSGAWWFPIDPPGSGGSDAPVHDDVLTTLCRSGFLSVGLAPIWWEGRMVGVLAVCSRTPEDDQWCDARTAVLDELGSFAGQVLGAQAGRRTERRRHHDEIRSVIDDGAFHPVFQPVVDLTTGEVRGYEALTRFASGRAPDLVLQDAHEAGLGTELEAACALAAVRASAGLPAGPWLAVNFSPASIIAGTAASVASVAAAIDRPLIVEITEHVEVESYAAVRTSVRSCPGVRISVDDAGAGYASLRHILELQPDFVKLDIGLVRHIDDDPARQALAAGLRHYARRTGTTLIAEGVETPAERDTLRHLAIPLAQGYLFGKPEPVESAAGRTGGTGPPDVAPPA